MLSRALILAAVVAMLGLLAAPPAGAQNLEAGKSPAAIFSSTCSICHKSARGLIKTSSPGSLPGFLRQHYTTSTEMASSMSAYVLSNGGATAAGPGGNLTKQGQDSRTAPKPVAGDSTAPAQAAKDDGRGRKPTREASRPDVDGLAVATPAPSPAPEPDGAKAGAKQKSAKGKQKAEQQKQEAAREPPKDEARPDPVPQVTPAQPGTEVAAAPAAPKSVAELPSGPLTIDIEPAAKSAPPETVASGPPAGRPAVPISQ